MGYDCFDWQVHEQYGIMDFWPSVPQHAFSADVACYGYRLCSKVGRLLHSGTIIPYFLSFDLLSMKHFEICEVCTKKNITLDCISSGHVCSCPRCDGGCDVQVGSAIQFDSFFK